MEQRVQYGKEKPGAPEITFGVLNILMALAFFQDCAECAIKLLVMNGGRFEPFIPALICLFTLPAVVLISPLWIPVAAKRRLNAFSISTYSLMVWLWVACLLLNAFILPVR